MSRTVPSFAEEGLKRFLHGMDRRIKDLERGGNWRFDTEVDVEEGDPVVRAGVGQLLVMPVVADSVASGGDYLTLSDYVYREGFASTGAAGQSIIWPTTAVGEIQVELAWDSYLNGGKIEIEVDGAIPAWGVLADETAGQRGSKRRSVHITAGSVVKVKVTQTSGSAQTCGAWIEFSIPDPSGATTSIETFPLLISDTIPSRTAASNSEVFFDQSWVDLYWDGTGTLMLAVDAGGTSPSGYDDIVILDVTHADGSTATYSASDGGDVTSYFEVGYNDIRVRFQNTTPTQVAASSTWLVKL